MRNMIRGVVTLLIVGWLFVGIQSQQVKASDQGTSDQAIALAAKDPHFAQSLDANPDWKAIAYYTGNRFMIWRVTFWTANDQDLGWADVSVAHQHVYWWETYFQPTEAQKKEAEETLRKFVLSQKEVTDLLGDPKDYFSGVHYEAKLNWWAIFFAHGTDSVAVIVEFRSEKPFTFENPVLKGFWFPDVLPYSEWKKAQESDVVAVAYQDAAISKAVRDHEGWTTTSELNPDATWTVKFSQDGKLLAQATVDLAARKVIKIQVP